MTYSLNMINSRFSTTVVLGAAVAALVSGCAGHTNVAVYDPDPVAAPAACADLLSPAVADRLVAHGERLDSSWPAEVPAHPLSVFYRLFVVTGGTSCQWDGGSGPLTYSAVRADAADRDEARRLLASLGYRSRTDGDDVIFSDPETDRQVEFAVTDRGVFGVAGGGRFDDISAFGAKS